MKISQRRGHEVSAENIERSDVRLVLGGADAQSPKAIGLVDAPNCLAACRTEFTKGMGIDPNGEPSVVMKNLCRKIDDYHLSIWFHDLYCCDSKYCGVDFTKPVPATGLDRETKCKYHVQYSILISTQPRLMISSVDVQGEFQVVASNRLLLNSDSNSIGIRLTDPGPPSIEQCGLGDENPFGVVSTPSGSALHGGFSMQLESRTTSYISATTWGNSETGTGATAVSVPSVRSSQPSDSSSKSSPSELDATSKIAVAVSATVTVLALILAISCLRKRRGSSRGHVKTQPTSRTPVFPYSTPSGSRASLISPPQPVMSKPLPPLTPPMRLSDRKFLPSVLDTTSERLSSAPPYTSQIDVASPKYPIYEPTANKPLPRNEKHATCSGDQPLLASDITISIPRNSIDSIASAPGTISSVIVRTLTVTEPATPPHSPERPQRPHEFPLEIPGLITPGKLQLGSLPTTESQFEFPPRSQEFAITSPISPLSPTSPISMSTSTPLPQPVSPVRAPSEVGLAIAMTRDRPVIDVGTQASSSDPSSLAQAYTRDGRGARASWGSWSGAWGVDPSNITRKDVKRSARLEDGAC